MMDNRVGSVAVGSLGAGSVGRAQKTVGSISACISPNDNHSYIVCLQFHCFCFLFLLLNIKVLIISRSGSQESKKVSDNFN